MTKALSKAELEALHCWEADDRVPCRPQMTDFRRRLRYHQAQWREANGHPVGSQPIAPKPGDKPVRLVGSRLPLADARQTGANFVTPGALDAARAPNVHHRAGWSWGRCVVFYPAGNADFADACIRYADLLADRSSFSSAAIEELLDSGALAPKAVTALRDRYIVA